MLILNLNRGYDLENEAPLEMLMKENHRLVLNLLVTYTAVLKGHAMADVVSAISDH